MPRRSLRWHEGIYTLGVPYKKVSRPPRYHQNTIQAACHHCRAALVAQVMPVHLQMSSMMNDVVHSSMSVMSPLTPSTAKPMPADNIHLLPTMRTLMGATQPSAQVKPDSNPNGIVTDPQYQGRDGKSMQPGSRLLDT